MIEAALFSVEKQGEAQIFAALASVDVAQMIESIMRTALAAAPVRASRSTPARAAKTPCAHVASHLLRPPGGPPRRRHSRFLVAGGFAEIEPDAGAMTMKGEWTHFLIGSASHSSRRLASAPDASSCRPCLDWSERRPHLAGRVGAALCAYCFARGWVRRVEGTHAVAITPNGRVWSLRDLVWGDARMTDQIGSTRRFSNCRRPVEAPTRSHLGGSVPLTFIRELDISVYALRTGQTCLILSATYFSKSRVSRICAQRGWRRVAQSPTRD